MSYHQWQVRVWRFIEPDRWGDPWGRLFDHFIIGLILLNVLAVILGSVSGIQQRYGSFLRGFETFSIVVFTLEYGLRLWSAPADPRFSEPIAGRLRFAIQPLPLIDLLVILPYYLLLTGTDLRVIRTLRVLRLLRIAKLARYYRAFHIILRVIRLRQEELVLTLGILLILLIISSSLMFYAEHDAQPQHFPDIPNTMWWAIVTLTTVGYGDVYPVTGVGRLLAALISIFGIGMVALPAGIIGSGFVEEVSRDRREKSCCCPHCGQSFVPEEED